MMDWTSAKLPAEWEPQAAIWLTWPSSTTHWDGRSMATKWAEITALISETQCVRINAPGEEHHSITEVLKRAKADLTQVELYDHPSDDVWCRDHGALFVRDACGEVCATSWEFNGWGGAFGPVAQDNEIAVRIANSQKMPYRVYPEVLEGGAIEVNGDGLLLTTEAVLLNKNRNPQLGRGEIEALLKERLGARETLWLHEGIIGDDTGGHIDDIARFTSKNTIVVASEEGGANAERLAENSRRLKEWGGAELVALPLPSACEAPGWRLPFLPASYANFLITNASVLVPTFAQPQKDQYALGLLAELFPSREVRGVPSLELVQEGGALHCISMQEPLSTF